jgi:hypothetical protein
MKSAKQISRINTSRRRAPPNTVNGTASPHRGENVKRRPREYLTVKEGAKLLERKADAAAATPATAQPNSVAGTPLRIPYGNKDVALVRTSWR